MELLNCVSSFLGEDQEATYEQLKRVEVRTMDEDFLLETILGRARLYFSEPQQAVDALLHLIIVGEHLEFTEEEISKTLIERGITYLDVLFEHDEVKTFSENHRHYLFNLITQLEERKGVSEYIELSGESEWVEVNQGGKKNQPRKSWEPEFTLLEPKKNDAEISTVTHKSKLESINEAAEKFDQFVLTGEPGAGKSTILRRFCLEAARLCLADFGNTPIPLLLDLPSWKGETPPEDFIVENWPFEGDPLPLLAEGKIKLYLDGLNEMGASGLLKAQQLKKWIHGLDSSGKPTTDFSKPKMVVITCRSLDYSGDLNLELPVIRLEELSDEKIKSFVYNYLSESAKKFLGRVLPEADESQEDVRHLLGLSRNPYMLASLVYLFEQSPDGELPQNTGTLFQRLVETLWHREGLRGTHNNLPVSEIQYPLARLAFSMIDSDMPTSISLDYAMFYLGDEKYLQLAQRASFLIVSGNRVQFYHQLMQEYFAAVGLSSVGVSHIQINQMLRQVGASAFSTLSITLSSKWDQVTIALCGIMNNPEEIIARIATINPSLAQRCLSSGVDVNEMSIVPSLLDALKNEDETIRRDAVYAIGNSAK